MQTLNDKRREPSEYSTALMVAKVEIIGRLLTICDIRLGIRLFHLLAGYHSHLMSINVSEDIDADFNLQDDIKPELPKELSPSQDDHLSMRFEVGKTSGHTGLVDHLSSILLDLMRYSHATLPVVSMTLLVRHSMQESELMSIASRVCILVHTQVVLDYRKILEVSKRIALRTSLSCDQTADFERLTALCCEEGTKLLRMATFKKLYQSLTTTHPPRLLGTPEHNRQMVMMTVGVHAKVVQWIQRRVEAGVMTEFVRNELRAAAAFLIHLCVENPRAQRSLMQSLPVFLDLMESVPEMLVLVEGIFAQNVELARSVRDSTVAGLVRGLLQAPDSRLYVDFE